MSISACGHIRPAFSKERYSVVKSIIDALKGREKDFDSIVCTGLSGLLIAPTVAMILGKELVVVRKSKEDRHSTREVEGYGFVKNYVIVDDLVDSGDSVRRMVEKVDEFSLEEETKCIGVYCYHQSYCCASTNDLPAPIVQCNYNFTDDPLTLTLSKKRKRKPKVDISWSPY